MDANPSSLVSLKKSLGLRQTQQRSCEDTKGLLDTPGLLTLWAQVFSLQSSEMLKPQFMVLTCGCPRKLTQTLGWGKELPKTGFQHSKMGTSVSSRQARWNS